ncbi:MAG: hypothetical protein JWS12_296 [Candidatus Saccharibacteria bacterium]|nr:hypothetical protein [Candidatus Saccharibacteria bacterium]
MNKATTPELILVGVFIALVAYVLTGNLWICGIAVLAYVYVLLSRFLINRTKDK